MEPCVGDTHDLPVLAAVVRFLDEANYPLARVSEIAEACGLSIDEVAVAVKALDGTYLTLKTTLGEPRLLVCNSAYERRSAGRRRVAALTIIC